MALHGNKGIGIPITMVHEAEGMVLTVELKTGDSYRGTVTSAEDTMNCCMKNVVHTDQYGRKTTMESVFIRGSKVLYWVFPDTARHAPYFERLARVSTALRAAARGQKLSELLGAPKAPPKRKGKGKDGSGAGAEGKGSKGDGGAGTAAAAQQAPAAQQQKGAAIPPPPSMQQPLPGYMPPVGMPGPGGMMMMPGGAGFPHGMPPPPHGMMPPPWGLTAGGAPMGMPPGPGQPLRPPFPPGGR